MASYYLVEPLTTGVQSEGALAFLTMTFAKISRARTHICMSAEEIAQECGKLQNEWSWVYAFDYPTTDLSPLLVRLKEAGQNTALRTDGSQMVQFPVDWLSVKPANPDFCAEDRQ